MSTPASHVAADDSQSTHLSGLLHAGRLLCSASGALSLRDGSDPPATSWRIEPAPLASTVVAGEVASSADDAADAAEEDFVTIRDGHGGYLSASSASPHAVSVQSDYDAGSCRWVVVDREYFRSASVGSFLSVGAGGEIVLGERSPAAQFVPCPPRLEGWMGKKASSGFHLMQKRLFHFEAGVLSYFHSEGEAAKAEADAHSAAHGAHPSSKHGPAKGVFPWSDLLSVNVSHSAPLRLDILLRTGRRLELALTDSIDVARWVAALTGASWVQSRTKQGRLSLSAMEAPGSARGSRVGSRRGSGVEHHGADTLAVPGQHASSAASPSHSAGGSIEHDVNLSRLPPSPLAVAQAAADQLEVKQSSRRNSLVVEEEAQALRKQEAQAAEALRVEHALQAAIHSTAISTAAGDGVMHRSASAQAVDQMDHAPHESAERSAQSAARERLAKEDNSPFVMNAHALEAEVVHAKQVAQAEVDRARREDESHSTRPSAAAAGGEGVNAQSVAARLEAEEAASAAEQARLRSTSLAQAREKAHQDAIAAAAAGKGSAAPGATHDDSRAKLDADAALHHERRIALESIDASAAHAESLRAAEEKQALEQKHKETEEAQRREAEGKALAERQHKADEVRIADARAVLQAEEEARLIAEEKVAQQARAVEDERKRVEKVEADRVAALAAAAHREREEIERHALEMQEKQRRITEAALLAEAEKKEAAAAAAAAIAASVVAAEAAAKQQREEDERVRIQRENDAAVAAAAAAAAVAAAATPVESPVVKSHHSPKPSQHAQAVPASPSEVCEEPSTNSAPAEKEPVALTMIPMETSTPDRDLRGVDLIDESDADREENKKKDKACACCVVQ